MFVETVGMNADKIIDFVVLGFVKIDSYLVFGLLVDME